MREMAINKVVYDGETLMDLSGDTLADSSQLLSGVTAHASNGTALTGSLAAMSADVYDPAGGAKQVAFAEELNSYLPLTGGTVTGELAVTGNLTLWGTPVFAAHSTFSGTTFDDLTIAPGIYWCHLSEISGGPASSGYGWLVVYPNQKMQDFTVYSNHRRYTRGYTNNQWYGWTLQTGGQVKTAGEGSKNVTSAQVTAMTNLSLEAGTWVVTGAVQFENNFISGSNLAVNISSNSGDAGFSSINASRDNHTSNTVIERLTVIVVPTTTTTYYLNCYHSCGAAKTVKYHMSAVRIA